MALVAAVAADPVAADPVAADPVAAEAGLPPFTYSSWFSSWFEAQQPGDDPAADDDHACAAETPDA